MYNHLIAVSGAPDASASSEDGKIVTVERLQTGVHCVKVNGKVVAKDPSGTVLRPLMQALSSQ
ncbi:hypothetical protein OCUBac02_29500 [Bosea sp. ANAM02]|nr:hypothetical protein OCUBac02_29500 [Bosea sp. ANAM02]